MATVLFFLPSILCLLFGFQYFFRKKNRSQRYMMYLLFIGAFYFTTYAFYISPETDYHWLCRLDAINEPVFLCCMSVFIAYIHLYIQGVSQDGKRKKKVTSRNLQWLIMPAITFGAVNMMLYYLLDFDTAAEMLETSDEMGTVMTSPEVLEKFSGKAEPTIVKLHYLFNHIIFTIMAIAYALTLAGSCIYCGHMHGYRIGDVFRFFCRGQETVPARATSSCTMMLIVSMVPLLILGRSYFVHNLWAGVAMTMFIVISLFILTNAEMMSQRKRFTVHDIVTSSLAESGVIATNTEQKEEEDDEREEAKKVIAKNAPGDLLAIKTKHIVEKMHEAFESGKAYSNPELTVAMMAEMIGTNRTTLSNIVNQQYGVTFRDLANRYRIDAAKAYILQHPTATQEEIAVACGFRSASALNHKFKEITGMPPTLWLTTKKAGEA